MCTGYWLVTGAGLSEHLGYGKHDQPAGNGGNSRNGTCTKTVLTDIGPVQLEVSFSASGATLAVRDTTPPGRHARPVPRLYR